MNLSKKQLIILLIITHLLSIIITAITAYKLATSKTREQVIIEAYEEYRQELMSL